MNIKNSSLITINSSNSTVTNNNVFEYQLRSSINLKNYEVCLSKAFIYNSVFNIDQALFQNTSYQYIYPNGAGFNTHTINMPSGYYDVTNLNLYLQAQMFANNEYLIDANSQPVYFLSFNANVIYYRITLTSTPLPTVLPSGWSLPVGAPTLPTVATTPKIVILPSIKPNIGFGVILGFSPGTYPAIAQSTLYNIDSNLIPQLSPQYAFFICTNLVNEPFLNSIPTMIYPFSFTQSLGSQQIIEPAVSKYYGCIDGQYSSIIIRILDQQGRPAFLQDPASQFVIELKRI